ncbi:GHMP family kinase ATP-binding protein [[Mycoplasma] testudinis]|uniref:GHMP family kinase ATP-binding protein n=1 Tax=[Mycoplasma] testudinis TaxID=33924 RepID=UPI000487343E|nr:hypothetical protein [[Mycoplasma] testudinis]
MVKLLSPSKVNLFLKIDSYDEQIKKHRLSSVFVLSKQFKDTIKIYPNNVNSGVFYFFNKKCKIIENDLVSKTLSLLSKKYKKEIDSYRIEIYKKIPLGSGLGGASSNAATIIFWFYQKFKIAKKRQLSYFYIATELGSDIPFFLSGYDVAFVSNFGDEVTLINSRKINHRIIINNINCNTTKVFEEFENSKDKKKFKRNQLMAAAFAVYPELKKIYLQLKKQYPHIIMSGSGSSFVNFKGLNYE